MPIYLKTCLERDVLYAKWKGRITLPEYVDVFRTFTQGLHYWPGRPELIDTSEMLDFDAGFHEMRGLLRSVNTQCPKKQVTTKTVVFCPSDFIFGLGHMYQQLASLDTGIEVELYEEETEALTALNLPYPTIADFLCNEKFV